MSNLKMKQYKFIGDWKFDLYLPELAKLIYKPSLRAVNKSTHVKKMLAGYVPVEIHSRRDYNPDPVSSQEKTIAYLLDNEVVILKKLLEHVNTKINIVYAELLAESDWIPKVDHYRDLNELIGTIDIKILPEEKNGLAYYQINGNYVGDEEHGLEIVMHGERLIEFSAIGESSYAGIYEDLGDEQEEMIEVIGRRRDFGKDMIHMPLKKYGKYKPWQLEATEDYFRKLLRNQENDKLVEDIEKSNWNINYRFPDTKDNLIDLATGSSNLEMMEYLIANGADFSKSLHKCIGFYLKENALKCLLKHGVNIDTLGRGGYTVLFEEIKGFGNALVYRNSNFEKDTRHFEQAIKKIQWHKNKILFYLSLGADPNKCNQQGDDYRTLLAREWNIERLRRNNVFEEIEKILPSNKEAFSFKRFFQKIVFKYSDLK